MDSHPRSCIALTALVSALVTVASVLGLVDRDTYALETTNWASQARGQDVGNLLAVVTLVIGSVAMSRGSLRGAMVWLGALLYLVYAYVVYSMALHFNQLFLVYVAVLGLSSYAVLLTMNTLRATAELRPPAVGRRLPGVTSIGIGVVFGLLWLSELVPATLSDEVPQSVVDAGLWVNPIHVIDLAVLLPGFVIVGHLGLKGHAAGLFWLGPLLVFSVLMGASIVAAMVIMTVTGFDDTWPPLAMMTGVVLLSLVAARRHLSDVASS